MRLSHHAAFAALASLLWMLTACSKPAAAVDPVRAVRTIEVTADSAGGRLEFAAEVRARTETRLGFRVPGKLVQRPVGLGDSVRAGQLLAELDPQDLKLGQDSARAGLAAAQAGFDQAQADFGRYRELRDQGFISSAELERRDTALKAARAQLQQAQAQSAAQSNQASYARLQAGVAGVVTAVEAEPGMVLAAGASVLRLAHDGPRDAVFSVPEDKVDLIKALANGAGGLSLRPWGSPEVSLPAQVREIAAAVPSACV
jgi:RND family efflux transporter MFP subunit